MSYTIGIDLGGSCVKAVVVTPDGKTLTSHNLPFDAEADMEWANRLRELVQSIEEDQDGKPDNMGFSAPGLAAADGSCITHMPVRLEGLVGLNWQKFFDFGKAIPVLNDGHAALPRRSLARGGEGIPDRHPADARHGRWRRGARRGQAAARAHRQSRSLCPHQPWPGRPAGRLRMPEQPRVGDWQLQHFGAIQRPFHPHRGNDGGD